jgi:hypothetical protein
MNQRASFDGFIPAVEQLFAPIMDAAEDQEALNRLARELGYTEDPGGLVTLIGNLAELKTQLQGFEGDDLSIEQFGAVLDAADSIFSVVSAASAVGFDEFGKDLLVALIATWLRVSHPVAHVTAKLLCLIEPMEAQEFSAPQIVNGEVVRKPYRQDRFYPERVIDLLRDPVAHFKAHYLNDLDTANDAAEVADKLFGRLNQLFPFLDVSSRYGINPGDESLLGGGSELMAHSLIVYFDDELRGAEVEAGAVFSISPRQFGDLGLVVSPFGTLTLTKDTENWTIESTLEGQVDTVAWGRHGLTLLASSGTTQVGAKISAKSGHGLDNSAVFWGSSNGTHLQIGEIELLAKTSLSEEAQELELGVGLRPCVFALKPSKTDGFLASILPADGLKAQFDLSVTWSSSRGLSFQGGGGLEINIPVGASIGGVTFRAVHLGIRANDQDVRGEVSASISAVLGPVTAVIDRIGAEAILTFPDQGGSLGVADLRTTVKPPSGVGLAIDIAGVASGGGFLFYDAGRSLYAGVLEISLSELCTLKAYGLIQTELPDGSPGYSLVIFLTAEDFEPIQLGMGFTLNGIGGMVAVNRTFDEAAIRQGMKDGLLGAILFPKDPVANAPAVIQALTIAFPAKRGAYLVGVLVKIGWFTPTLVSLDLALIMEIGRRHRLLVLGRISALLPSPDNDLVRINLDSIGFIDFDEGTVEVDAVLVDSRLVDKFPLTGAMALRARWSDEADSSFVLSIGGLNPRFSPPPGLPKLDRIAIALSSGNNPRITCEAYFAITSNTVQFGASASLYAKSHGFSIEGDIGFDVLIEYQPLHFLADFHASVQLKRGSHNLFKVKVNGTLEGPRPLRVSGKASFEICWCDFSVHFDKTLVEGEAPPPPPAIELLPQLRLALADPRSWSSTSQALHGVSLKSTTEALAVDPTGQLAVRQRTVPLNSPREIDLFGGAPVAGDHRFTFTATLNQQTPDIEPLFEQFAPAQFFSLSEEEKLTLPSFDRLQAGVALGKTASTYAPSQAVPAPLDYELVLIDADQPLPAQPPFKLDHEPFDLFLRRGAAALAPVRRTGSERFREEAKPQAVTLKEPEWSVVPVGDLAEAGAETRSESWVEASASLARLNRGRAKWQIVPAHELAA